MLRLHPRVSITLEACALEVCSCGCYEFGNCQICETILRNIFEISERHGSHIFDIRGIAGPQGEAGMSNVFGMYAKQHYYLFGSQFFTWRIGFDSAQIGYHYPVVYT